MSFMEHLEELRKRIIRILVILIVSFAASYHFAGDISEFLLLPLRNAIGNQGDIVFTGLFDRVVAEFQIGFWSCVFFASPFWFREAWLFIRPGLYDSEIKVIRPFLFLGFLLFIGGVVFGYYVIFPFTFKTLVTAGGVDKVRAMINMQEYLMLSCKILVVLGLLFQLPNIMLILGFMGLVTKYRLRDWRRYMAVIFATLAAIITPTPDPGTMMVLWVPLMLLYEIGIIGVTLIVHPYLERKHMGDNQLASKS